MNGNPCFGNPSATAQRRMQRELREWQQNPPEGCSLKSAEPLHEWLIHMDGPAAGIYGDSMYAGKSFTLRVRFTDRYPIESPEVVFLRESPTHPHIYTNGHICLDILYDSRNGGWSPALTISKVCYSLRSMLASNTSQTRPEGDQDYCMRVRDRSPKTTTWSFDDDRLVRYENNVNAAVNSIFVCNQNLSVNKGALSGPIFAKREQRDEPIDSRYRSDTYWCDMSTGVFAKSKESQLAIT